MLCPGAMARFTFFSSMRIFLQEIVDFRMAIFAGLSP
jgi:hypothetical protein